MKAKDYMYAFRNMDEENDIFKEGENLLSIPYVTETGRGNFKLNMQAAFPVSKSDFRKICDMIRLSPEYDAVLGKLTAYIDAVLRLFDEYRKVYAANDTRTNAEITTVKKRWLSMREVLEKEFSISPAEADSSVVKFKKCDVLTMTGKHGNAEIELHSGFRFEKFGRVFHCYQKSRGLWQIIVPQFGLATGSYANNKAACAETVTEQIVALIDGIFDAETGTEQSKKAISMRADFERAVSESDFAWIMEGNADYAMPGQPQEATEGAEAAETVKHTAEATEAHTEATESKETAENAETVTETEETAEAIPDTQHIDIMAFCAEYRQILQKLRCDPLYLPRSRPADRQTRKKAISFYDDTLRKTELVTRFITAVHDIIDTAQKATAFTLAYYAILERQRERQELHRNGIRSHTMAYAEMLTERHKTPQKAVLHSLHGIVRPSHGNGRRKPQRRHTGKLCLPCVAFRSIPGTAGNCRAIVTDTS